MLLKAATSEFPEGSVQSMQDMYFEALSLDGKPEKGERKIADDFVLMINESLEQDSQVTSNVLYRIALMEYAMELSPYNFDIQLQLALLYDKLGLSVSFKQAHDNLNLKGVQLESMGYLHLRHSVDYAAFESILKPVYVKYQKYWSLNALNLRQMKQQSFNEDNYEQIENFVEYENFLNRSYFHHLQAMVAKAFENLKASATNPDFSRDFFLDHASLLLSEHQAFASLTRTQDIKIV